MIDRGASNRRQERATELVAHLAAEFIRREESGRSLITVTRAESRSHGELLTVFVTVFPNEEIGPALGFLARHVGTFRDHLRQHARLNPLPKVEFMLDDGSQNQPPIK